MSDSAAFQATYADWKVIKTRKLVQVILELPLEHSDAAYQALGGMPNVAAEVWVGVARLDPNVRRQKPVESVSSKPQHTTTSEEGKPARLSYAQRAGLLSNRSDFQLFLNKRYGTARNKEAAADQVRKLCEVESRADILPNTKAAVYFDTLESAFGCWLIGPSVGV